MYQFIFSNPLGKLARDLTGVREMGPRLFQGNQGWWNMMKFGQNPGSPKSLKETIILVGVYNQQFQGTIRFNARLDLQGKR